MVGLAKARPKNTRIWYRTVTLDLYFEFSTGDCLKFRCRRPLTLFALAVCCGVNIPSMHACKVVVNMDTEIF